MRKWIDLIESPVEEAVRDITFHGSTEPASLNSDDIGIVNSPKGRTKIIDAFQKAPIDIRLAFINHSRQFSDPDGVASPLRAFTGGYMQNADPASGHMTSGEIKRIFGVDIPDDPDALTAVFAFNEGDGRRPFTPWMVAHRLGHLINERGRSMDGGIFTASMRTLNQVWNDLDYDARHTVSLDHILHEIGTFKSARDGTVRSVGEFVLECFAQFLISGKVTFKQIGDSVQSRATPGTRQLYPKLADMLDAAEGRRDEIPNPVQVNEALSRWKKMMVQDWTEELHNLVGKIIVM